MLDVGLFGCRPQTRVAHGLLLPTSNININIVLLDVGLFGCRLTDSRRALFAFANI